MCGYDRNFYIAMHLNESNNLSAEIDPRNQLFSFHAFDNLPIAIYSCDKNGYLIAFNKAAAKIWGRTPETGKEQWSGAYKTFKVNGDPLPAEEGPVARLIQQKAVIGNEEIIIEQPDGKQLRANVNAVPVYDEEGAVKGAVCNLIDVTSARDTEIKQSMLAALVNSSDDTIVSKTLQGIITSWNGAAERMFGYAAEEAVGKHISLIIPPERLKEEEYIIGQIARGNKVDHFETYRMTKNGKLVPLSITVSPIIDSKGHVIGASKIARDISQQKKAQQDLLDYTSKLEAISSENTRLYEEVKALNEKKDEFIGLASHELKTPITSIMGYLQILTRFNKDKDANRFIAKTLRQVKRLSTLVSDLLDVSKIEAGKLQLVKEKFDIRPTIDDAIELIQHTNATHHILLHTQVQSAVICGDPQRIEQVIINLLTNAIKYSPQGKKVEIFLSVDTRQVKIGVKDEGLGIPADRLDQIFNRFYRVEELNSNISGLGIGLYISKEIIERHNGKIWVDSTLEKGSTFWLTLPLEK